MKVTKYAPVLFGGRRGFIVDSASGSNANTGTGTAAAWQSLDYAVAMLSSGGVLNLVAPATAPFRNGMAPADTLTTIRGASASSRAYITGSVDVSHDAAVANKIMNGDCEAWLSSSSMWATVTTGNALARSTDSHGGTYAINATRATASPNINFYVYLPAATAVDFTYWHKYVGGAGRWKFYVIESGATPDNYLQANGTWSSTPYQYDPNDANTSWHSYTLTFTSNGEGIYIIQMAQGYTTTLMLDDISVSYNGITAYAWGDVADHNYKLLNVKFPLTPNILAKCTAANWTSTGMEALAIVPKAADLATCDATPGSWFYDADTDQVYYTPAVAEDVTGLHMELSQPRLTTSATQDTGLVNFSASNVNLQNLHVRMGNTYSIYNSAQTGINLSYVDHKWSGSIGCAVVSGGAMTARNCIGSYTYSEDVWFATGAGSTLTCVSCRGSYGYDDGFQATAGGSVTCHRCIADNNGVEEAVDNSGFSAEGDGSSMDLANVLAWGNYGHGISHSATGAGSFRVRNSIAHNTTAGAVEDAHVAVTHSTFTHTNNVVGGHAIAWELDATEAEADPLLTDPGNGDFTLQAESPAIDAGMVIAGVTEGYLGDAPDCGVYEKA